MSQQSERVRCARDSDWCDGLRCADIGNPGCPNSDIAAVGRERGCIGPYPCGVGAGGNGDDLPCDCESLASTGEHRATRPRPCDSKPSRECRHGGIGACRRCPFGGEPPAFGSTEVPS